MRRLLFVCMGNDHISQMAEAYLRHMAGWRVEVMSAGVEARGLDPWAVEVMREEGIDISGQTSKLVDIYMGEPFDIVVTLSDAARDTCPPIAPNATHRHRPLEALDGRDQVGAMLLARYRRVRNEVRTYCQALSLEFYASPERQRSDPGSMAPG